MRYPSQANTDCNFMTNFSPPDEAGYGFPMWQGSGISGVESNRLLNLRQARPLSFRINSIPTK
jgi:hypothetical protein